MSEFTPPPAGLRLVPDPEVSLFDLHEQWFALIDECEELGCELSDWKLNGRDPAEKPAAEERHGRLKDRVERLANRMMAVPIETDVDLAVLMDIAINYDLTAPCQPGSSPGEFGGWVHLAKVVSEVRRRAPSVRFYSIEKVLCDEQRDALFG